jgi:hypothetical protein
MSKYYAVIQHGTAIYGIGASPSQAIDDSKQWVDNPDTIEDEIVDLYQANYGDMICVPCSEKLARKVQDGPDGGAIDFEMDSGTAVLPEEVD